LRQVPRYQAGQQGADPDRPDDVARRPERGDVPPAVLDESTAFVVPLTRQIDARGGGAGEEVPVGTGERGAVVLPRSGVERDRPVEPGPLGPLTRTGGPGRAGPLAFEPALVVRGHRLQIRWGEDRVRVFEDEEPLGVVGVVLACQGVAQQMRGFGEGETGGEE